MADTLNTVAYRLEVYLSADKKSGYYLGNAITSNHGRTVEGIKLDVHADHRRFKLTHEYVTVSNMGFILESCPEMIEVNNF